GTNGFYLNYSDSSSLGTDSSGQGNDFTPGNLVATDQVLDSPSNNFATLNLIAPALHGAGPVHAVITKAALKHTGVSSTYVHEILTQAVSSGKWYVEFCVNTLSTDSNMYVGVGNEAGVITDRSNPEANTKSVALQANGQAWKDGNTTTSHSSGAYGTVGHIVGISLNLDDNEVKFFVNNSAFTLTTSITGGGDLWTFWVLTYNTEAVTLNAGQDSSFAGAKTAQNNKDANGKGDFYYAPPAGHLALCTDNISDPAIDLPSDHFNTLLYTANDAAGRSITGVGFAPDLVWAKERASAHHVLVDSVRGTSSGGRISSNRANAEDATSGVAVGSFDSDGFTVGSSAAYLNSGTTNYVSWNWKAGGTASSNSDGSITSSVSANTTAGFSIVTYAGTGSAGATVGHGLSQTPDLIMIKNRTGITNWVVNSPIINSGFTKWAMKLDITEAMSTDSTIWNNTAPTSSVFTLGTAGESNRNNPDNYVAYCFHSVEGYSKVGTYTGNGNADGSFVYTGFRPMWVMAKCTDGTASWLMTDSVRQPYNVTDDPLFANENSAETNSSTYAIDILSSGFKCRGVNNDTNNSDGNVYIYLAFAESPFKYANAR
ncbi:MAG: hypothetical protein GY893_03480, partial [bacterium]|nr:hypothetical protein [bacterium]